MKFRFPIAFIGGLILLTLLLPACAYVNSNTTVTQGTNGVTHSSTHARSFTFFDSQASIAKFRNSTGGPTNTYTQGTAVSGFDQSSSASNVVAIINAAAAVAGKVP